MTRAKPISESDRAALADALRHMRGSGLRYGELVRLAGKKVRLMSNPVRIARADKGPA